MKNIFVGNLHAGTTEASLRSTFEPHGTVNRVKLMIDRETGLSRGFAFVEMEDAEADLAITALKGGILDGQAIDVHEGRRRLHLVGAPREPRVPRQ